MMQKHNTTDDAKRINHSMICRERAMSGGQRSSEEIKMMIPMMNDVHDRLIDWKRL